MTASYSVFVRNSANNEIGQIDDFETLTLNPHFNAVGAWALSIPLDSPSAALLTPGTGIVVYRNGTAFFSGPLGSYHLAGDASGDTLTVGGPDDMTVLADRLALPVHGYPYSSIILANSPKRYYRLANTADLSGNAATLSVFGSVGNASSLIDDPDQSATFDGSTGYLSFSATGLPTGAAAWSLEAWVYLTSYAATNGMVLSFGAIGTDKNAQLLVNASGKAQVATTGVSASSSAALALNTVHHLVGTYDGTNLRMYVDGALAGGPTAVTCAITLSFGTIGSFNNGASNFFAGTIDEAAVYSAALSASDITNHYNTGISRFAAAANEVDAGLAGGGIWFYSDVNAGPDAGGTGSGDSGRIVSSLSIGSQPAIGSFVQASARFDNLLDLCTQLAISGGDLGFRVLQSGTSLALTIYVPNDKTSNAKFSRDLGNLLDYDYDLSRPKANYVYVLGGGQGTSRKVLEFDDTASLSTWSARIEGTVDARDTSDADTMTARGSAFLDQSKSQINFSCTAIDTTTLTFGTDYGLGDKVVVYLPDGTTVTDIVREVMVTLDRQNGEDVKVGIGNPGNGAILTPANAALKSVMQTHVAVASRVAQLERRW